jgi:hypothetical protein
MPHFYKNTFSLNELDEKPNYTKISKFSNFEKKIARKKTHFLTP